MANKNDWKDNGSCLNYTTELFFDRYEEDVGVRQSIDSLCGDCPLVRHCFAVGVSQKEWGVWGGIYLEAGKISRDINRHRSKADWAKTWQTLTTDKV